MASKMAILFKARASTPSSFRMISTFSHLSQEPQLVSEPTPDSHSSTPMPPNPSSGTPFYQAANFRPPITDPSITQSLIPLGLLQQTPSMRIQTLSQTLDVASLMNVFADWMTSQRWSDMKQLFDFWIRCLDNNGKPNRHVGWCTCLAPSRQISR